MASSCGAPPRGGTLHGPHEGRRSLGDEPHSAAATRSPRSVAEVRGGLSACPALRRPAGRGMGLPLGTPGPGPPAPRSPTRAAPGLTPPARHPAAHAGDSALPTTGTPSRVSRPGLAPPGAQLHLLPPAL